MFVKLDFFDTFKQLFDELSWFKTIFLFLD